MERGAELVDGQRMGRTGAGVRHGLFQPFQTASGPVGSVKRGQVCDVAMTEVEAEPAHLAADA